MAKRTIGFENYNEATYEEYQGEPPLPNRWYTGQVNRAIYQADRDQVGFIIEITEGDYAGWGKGWYAPLDPDDTLFWKTQEIIRALQGGLKKPVALDWENEAAVANWLKKQKPIRFKTELYNEDVKIKKVAPLMQAVGASGTTKAAPAPAPEPEPEELDDEPLEDYTEEDLTELTVTELEAILADEFELPEEDMPEKGTGRGAAAKYKTALIEAILEEQDPSDEDEDENQDAIEADADGDDFEDGFDDDDADADEEPEPEPEPAPRTRRRTAAAPAPAKAAPAAARTRRR